MSNKDKVEFFIGNETQSGRMTDIQDYSANIKNYEIKYDMFSGAGSFTASLDTRVEMTLYQKPMKFMWKINGLIMMKGYIDKKEFSYSKGSFIQNISGRDMMQVLLDNFVLYPKPYENKTLKYIIQDVWDTSRKVTEITNLSGNGLVKRSLSTPVTIPSLSFLYTADAEGIVSKLKNFKHIKTQCGQSIFDFISNLCNQVGLFLYNIPGTNDILIHTATSPNDVLKSFDKDGTLCRQECYYFCNSTTVPNKGSNNIISCSFSEDITNFHKYLKLIGQAQQDSSIAGSYYKTVYGLTQGQLKIEKFESVPDGNTTIRGQDLDQGYTGLMKFKVSNVNECDLEAWVDTRDLIINNLLLQQNRKLFSLKYTVANHSPDKNSDPYFFNRMAVVRDDFISVDGIPFLVYAVSYKGSKEGGMTTDVTLCWPSISLMNKGGLGEVF